MWCVPEFHNGEHCLWCKMDELDKLVARANHKASMDYINADRIRQEQEGGM